MKGHKDRAVAVGVDGCHGGWVAVIADGPTLRTVIMPDIAPLLAHVPDDALIAIDIPIGLPDQGARDCDRQARRYLGRPRASSVFPAPLRPILVAGDYPDACRMRQAIEGKKMSKQTFAILPKIREVDRQLRLNPTLLERVHEVHPEVSFAAWNKVPMKFNKKSRAGRSERERLIRDTWPGVIEELTNQLSRNLVKPDDLNDAFAALWSALRIQVGTALMMPQFPVFDSAGLPMKIAA